MDRAAIVFPIRFATRLVAVQTTTRELSVDGVFVRCLQPPDLETPIAMKLYLPGARAGMEAAGIVREVEPSGGEAGFWADFLEMNHSDRAQITEVLARRERAAQAKPIGAIALQPAREEDARRAFPRVNARFAVRFATVQDFVLEYAANISAGGVFVQTDNPPAMDSIIKVEMELPGGGPPVQARGVVVHRVTKEEAVKRGVLAGVGVQFVEADDKFRDRIDHAIEHILQADK